MTAYSAAARPAWTPRRPRWIMRAAVAVVMAGLIAAGAFAAGEHHQSGMTIVTGVAAVGYSEASVKTGGWTYGLQEGGVAAWVDSQGMTHVGGWPACLAGPGTTRHIRLGWVPVTLPDGLSMRQVVWVGCQS